MSHGIHSFSSFYLDDSITGHVLLRPSIFVGRTAKRVVSQIPFQGTAYAWELTKRVFLSFLCFLIVVPSALLIPVGLAVKGLAYLCCSSCNQQAQREEKPVEKEERRESILNSSEEVEEIISPPENPIPETAVLKNTFTIQEIAPSGNCAYEAFLQGIAADSPDGVIQLRNQTAEWIKGRFNADMNDKVFEAHLRESTLTYFEHLKNELHQEREQIQMALSHEPFIGDMQYCIDRMQAIPAEQTTLNETLTALNSAQSLAEVTEHVATFINAIPKVDLPEKRVYASRIELYAFSHMHSTTIKIYTPFQEEYYNCIESLTPPNATASVSFLLNNTHYNLLKNIS